MSREDREFLERVMKEGIIDENERMKAILKQVTDQMQIWKGKPFDQTEEEEIQGLLEELRDIVEQIDYARAFAAMKGLGFLIGCAQERQHMPRSTRLACLGVLSTMAQHNPPVQKELLEMGALKTLSELFFAEAEQDADGDIRARLIQVISATVRGYELGESVFCELEQSVSLLEAGLGVNVPVSNSPPTIIQKRTLFFLRALVTSDASTRDRVRLFSSCIGWVADHLIQDQHSFELREIAVSVLAQVLEQRRSVDCILQRKDRLVALGVPRVAALRQLTGEDREDASVELETWEQLLVLLARATPDDGVLPQ